MVDMTDTEQLPVPRDRLDVELTLGQDATNPISAQSALNNKMKGILRVAAQSRNVQVETRDYETIPIRWQKPNRKIALWRAEETIDLGGTKLDQVLLLTGRLQKEGMAVTSMTYSVTSKRQRLTAKELTSKALRNLTAKATSAAEDLRRKFLYWSHITIEAANSSGPQPFPLMALQAGNRSTRFPSPTGVAGRAIVNVTVKGTAVFGPAR
jgi:predicted secreted protein